MLLTFLAEIGYLTRDLVVALFDLIVGARPRRYEHTVVIRAPRSVVWQALYGEITVGTATAVTEKVPDREDIYRTTIKVDAAESSVAMMWREALRREGETLHCEILAEGTEPSLIHGTGDLIGYELSDAPEGTRFTTFRAVTPASTVDAIMASFEVRQGGRTYKRTIEDAANLPPTTLERLTSSGLAISLLAVASFWYLLGIEAAALVIVVILLHELGHALAMWMVGMQVKGIYLVPFLGGLALPKAPYRTDFQIGFVCLMGPGFSLIPTFAFLLAYQATGSALLLKVTLFSAFINLLNLVPILPLDGGHVVRTILTAVNRRLAHVVAVIGVPFGLFGAWWLEDYLLGAFILIFGIALWFSDWSKERAEQTPMSRLVATALFAGLLATAAGHGYASYTAYAAWKQQPQVKPALMQTAHR